MQILFDERYTLAESPIWHPIREAFYWVDIVSGRVCHLDSDNKTVTDYQLSDKVGCIVPTDDGHILAALSKKLIKFDLDNQAETDIPGVHITDNEMFNDGKVDQAGRFWVASKDLNEQEGHGNLYCFDGKTFIRKETGLIVGNGIDWSFDNKTMYLCDSPRQLIYAYDFNVDDGVISAQRIFASIEEGYPDGLLVDNDDNVLSGHWAGGMISCYEKSGRKRDRLLFDAQNITSLAIGGKDKQTMFVTSAARDVHTNELEEDGYCFLLKAPYASKTTHCFHVDSLLM